jgi:hypothetical protein
MWNDRAFQVENPKFDSNERYISYTNLNKLFIDNKYQGSMIDLHKELFFDDEIYICGVASDVCVRCSIDGFLKNDHRIFIIEDLTKGVSKEIKSVLENEFYDNFKKNSKLNLINSNEIISPLNNVSLAA